MNHKIGQAILFIAALVIVASFAYSLSLSTSYSVPQEAFVRPGRLPAEEGGFDGQLQTEKGSKPEEKVVLAAVGDMMLSRNVEQKMIARNDWKYPFEKTAELTSGADLTFGNLETTIYPGSVIKSGSFTFRTDPKALEGLQYAGFDVLSLANNHMMNFGRPGLKSTLEQLDRANIAHAGAGLTAEGSAAPVIREAKGVKFGFLAYTYAPEQAKDGQGNAYGTNYMETERMKREVAALKEQADVVIVSMHAGTEYATAPHVSQTNFARTAVDAGAALVIGRHPHVVETAERYKDGYILYSLGNFVFDQMWSEETRLGAVAKITFQGKKIERIEFTPVKIYDYAQPQLAEGAQAQMISERLEIKG